MPEIRQWHASNVAPVWHLFSAKCGANLLCGALLARFVLIMGINAQRHIDRSVSCEILNLLDIQPALKQSCDVGMPELVRMNVEIQCADNLGVRRGRPKVVRIIICSDVNSRDNSRSSFVFFCASFNCSLTPSLSFET